MHPAVENPDPHEASVAVGPGRRLRRSVPLVHQNRGQRRAPLRGHITEARQQFGSGFTAQRSHPRLVHGSNEIADMLHRLQVHIGFRRGQSQQHGLGAHHMRDDGVYVPAGKVGRSAPFILAEIG